MDTRTLTFFAILFIILCSTFGQVQCQAKKTNSTARPRKTPRPARKPISSTSTSTTTTTEEPTTSLTLPTTTEMVDNSTVSVNFTLKSGNAVLVMVVDVVDYNESTIVTHNGPKSGSTLPQMKISTKSNKAGQSRASTGSANDESIFDLRGSENRLPPDSIDSPPTPNVGGDTACAFEGNLKCRDPRVVCRGFGEIDCENFKKCNIPSTMSCNMDLNKSKCTGRGSCKRPSTTPSPLPKVAIDELPFGHPLSDEASHQHAPSNSVIEVPATSTLSATETTIIAIAITLGLAVLAGTIAFVYVSADKLKIRPSTTGTGTTVLSASSTRTGRTSRIGSTDSNIS